MKSRTSDEDIVGAAFAARMIGMSPARLRQLALEGRIPREGNGRYHLPSVISANTKLKVDDALRRAQVDTQSSADKLRERRDQEIALRIAKEERKLIPIEDAEAEFEMVTGRFVAALEGLPARITREVHERRRITEIIDEIRLRLSADFVRAEAAMVMGVHGDDKIDE